MNHHQMGKLRSALREAHDQAVGHFAKEWNNAKAQRYSMLVDFLGRTLRELDLNFPMDYFIKDSLGHQTPKGALNAISDESSSSS